MAIKSHIFLVTLGALSVSVSVLGDFDANIFLEKTGYLNDLPDNVSHNEDDIRRGITEFQKFTGLRVTGRMDKQTIKKMKSPRCGVADVIKPNRRPSHLRKTGSGQVPLAYNAPGYKWKKNDITYKFMGFTRDVGGNDQYRTMYNAFKKWSDVTPLRFRRVSSGNADILLSFGSRSHGDGNQNAFDGKGGTLAHAFFPGESPISGDTHFDEDEDWSVRSEKGTNLEIVAAHEFGHALGLGHSSNPRALMAPYYQGYDPNYSLGQDDVMGIQSLYGSPNRPVPRPTTPPTRRPRRTRPTRPTRPITRRPRVTRRPVRPTNAPTGNYCSMKFDAIEQVHDGQILAFKGKYVYRITVNGPTNRRRIKDVYKRAPNSPGAAVYDRYKQKMYFLKGKRVWRFTGYTRDPGYPKTLPQDFWRVRAAMQFRDGTIYVFKGRSIATWDENMTRYARGDPLRARKVWNKFPSNVDATFRSYDGYYYSFKGQRYWRYNSRKELSPGYPKDSKPVWLNCRRPSRMKANALELSYLTQKVTEESIN